MKYKPGIFSEINISIVFVITSHRVHICQLSDLDKQSSIDILRSDESTRVTLPFLLLILISHNL